MIAPFPIVGVGASAGGLEALSQLLGALPIDTGMAFVLIQHLEPSHKSHLTAILSRATTMPVCEVGERMRIESNHVYVIPPNAGLGLAKQALHLVPRPVQPGPYLTIDAFFESLAGNQGRLCDRHRSVRNGFGWVAGHQGDQERVRHNIRPGRGIRSVSCYASKCSRDGSC